MKSLLGAPMDHSELFSLRRTLMDFFTFKYVVVRWVKVNSNIKVNLNLAINCALLVNKSILALYGQNSSQWSMRAPNKGFTHFPTCSDIV